MTEGIGKILSYHPGLIQESPTSWLLDVVQPHGKHEFPVGRLHALDLNVLILGFVTITLSRCSGFSGLEAFFLV